MGVHGDPPYRLFAAEAGTERGREAILDAFRGEADEDGPPANQRRGIIAANHLTDALEWKPMRTAVIIEQHLVPRAVEPGVWCTAGIGGRDRGLAATGGVALLG